MRCHACWLIPLFVFMLNGCAHPGMPYQARQPAPLLFAPALPEYQPEDASEVSLPSVPALLTLQDAIALVLERHPELAALEREIAALEAEALQAGLQLNPTLDAELENILGGREGSSDETQDLTGVSGAETTILLSQTLELGGKRAKRRLLAEATADLATWDYEARRLELAGEVHRVFVELLAAQERQAFADEQLAVARHADEAAGQWVAAGEISPLEQQRTAIGLSQLTAEHERAERDVEGLRRLLASLWGGEASFERAVGELRPPGLIPDPAALRRFLEGNPESARWGAEIAQRQAALELEEARAIQDPTIGIGGRHFNEMNNHAVVIGFSIPIPFHDRNQGNIQAARERRAQADLQRDAARRSLERRLSESHGRLATAEALARRLGEETLPQARQLFQTVLDAYHAGDIELYLLLDAQRDLLEVQDRQLEALIAYHTALAEVEILIGRPISEFASGDTHEDR